MALNNIPKGPTQEKWFRVGYQTALADVERELTIGGVNAVVEWLRNNLNTRFCPHDGAELDGHGDMGACPRCGDEF